MKKFVSFVAWVLVGSLVWNTAATAASKLPIFNTQPQTQSVIVGRTVTFTVAAQFPGISPTASAPHLQWRKNGSALPGETNSLLRIYDAQLSDAASFTVAASGTNGTSISSNAVLTVTIPSFSSTNIVGSCDAANFIAAVQAGGYLKIDCDGTVILTNTIVITNHTLIDATGHTLVIQGQGVGLFSVSNNAAFTLTNVLLTGGSNSFGGAIFNDNGVVLLDGCTVSNNVAVGAFTPRLNYFLALSAAGGGIFNKSGAVLVKNSLFQNNQTLGHSFQVFATTAEGGAIHNEAGFLKVEACSFEENSAVGLNGCTDCFVGIGGWQSVGGTPGMGGAIYNSGLLRIENSQLANNAAVGGSGLSGGNSPYPWNDVGLPGSYGFSGHGGALYNIGAAEVTQCAFHDQKAIGGVGGAGGSGGYFPANGAAGAGGGDARGGAVFNSGSLLLERSVLYQNSLIGGRGGNGGSPTLGTDPADGSPAGPGGDATGAGIYNAGSLALINTTITGNSIQAGNGGNGGTTTNGINGAGGPAGEAEGAAVFTSTNASFLNCTIAGNSLTNGVSGTGLAASSNGVAAGANIFGTNVCFANTIIANPSGAENFSGSLLDGGFNISSDASCNFTNAGSLNSTDPKLDSLADNGGPTLTMALLSGSPAIDAITNYSAPPTDQRGISRPRGLYADIGAFEVTEDIVVAPVILTQPVSQTVSNGAALTLTVSVYAAEPLFQWYLNGAILTNATNSILTIPVAEAPDNGNYFVVVSNVAGVAISSNAVVVVLSKPVIFAQPQSQFSIVGSNVTFTVVAAGGPTPHYQWRFNGVNLAGKTSPTLQLNHISVANGGNYSVVVANAFGKVTSQTARLTPQLPVTIIHAPVDQVVNTNATVTFAVTATGTALRYQWQFNGTNILNATNSLLKLSNVSAGNAGTSSVTVYNAVTLATASATLTLTNSPFDWNGDGQTDLLLRSSSGSFMTWSMNRTSIAKTFALNRGSPFDPNWRVVGLTDFDGDGRKDIVLQYTNGAVIYIDVLGTNFNSTNFAAGSHYSPVVSPFPGPGGGGGAAAQAREAAARLATAPPTNFTSDVISSSWRIVDVTDFNGDGAGDLLAQNINGTVGVWLLNGTNFVNTTPVIIAGTNMPANWQVVGTGDFNGDGQTDILWESSDGFLSVWKMNGTNFLENVSLTSKSIGSTSRVVAVADFNYDGKPDIILETTDGHLAVLFMNGTTIASKAALHNGVPISPAWRIVAPK